MVQNGNEDIKQHTSTQAHTQGHPSGRHWGGEMNCATHLQCLSRYSKGRIYKKRTNLTHVVYCPHVCWLARQGLICIQTDLAQRLTVCEISTFGMELPVWHGGWGDDAHGDMRVGEREAECHRCIDDDSWSRITSSRATFSAIAFRLWAPV
jgi:hypothetical protein